MKKRKSAPPPEQDGVFDVPKRRADERVKRTEKAQENKLYVVDELDAAWQIVKQTFPVTIKLADNHLLEYRAEPNDLDEQRAALEQMSLKLIQLREMLADQHMPLLRERAETRFHLPTLDSLVGNGSSERLRPSLILCDPPWQYKNPSHKVGTKKQYDTMSDQKIAALPVGGLASEDCALLMWCTLPKLKAGLRVMELWGFEYKTVFTVWVKIEKYMGRFKTTFGNYTRPNAEIVLIGMRGNMRSKLHLKNFNRPNVIMSTPSDHSRKPTILRNIAVELFGDVPRMELFCRESASDWFSWGNEVQGEDDAVARVDTEPENERHAATEKTERKHDLRGGAFRNAQTKQMSKPPPPKGKRRGRPARSKSATLEYLEHFAEYNCLGKNDAVVFRTVYDDDSDDDERNNSKVPADLANNSRIEEFCDEEQTLAKRRHPLYSDFSEAQVRMNLVAIRKYQIANADRLFAFNNNKKQRRIRLSVDGV